MRVYLCTAVVMLSLVSQSYAAEGLNADDFLTPAQGGSTEIQEPEKVTVDKKANIVKAATMQDAVNKASEILVDGADCTWVASKKSDNAGAVAVGRGYYRNDAERISNPDAKSLSKRHAYIEAYMNAKRNLAANFAEISGEAEALLENALSSVTKDDETLENNKITQSQNIKEKLDRMIKCYVVKEVKEIPEEREIRVTICVTAQSMGKYARPVPAMIDAKELKAGLQMVLDEVTSGVLLPEGGRVISTDKGELCYVGFASGLIRHKDNPDDKARAIAAARGIAETRARTALRGILFGDQIIWENKLVEKSTDNDQALDEEESAPKERGETKSETLADVVKQQIDNLKSFVDVSGEDKDATAEKSPEGIKKLNERKKEILTKTIRGDTTRSLIKGVLPPGIRVQTFRKPGEDWYYAVAIYNPSLTQAVSELGEEMDSSNPVQKIRKKGKGQSSIKKAADAAKVPTGADDEEYE